IRIRGRGTRSVSVVPRIRAATRHSGPTISATASNGSRSRRRNELSAQGVLRNAEGQRLPVPPRQAQARFAEPRPDGPLSEDGAGAEWPISYWDLKPSFERIERELPVAGQDWPWGDPHSYPHGPHPIAGAASVAWKGAREYGIEMRVGPVAITNGPFGNRPHCIYRGFCLEGCKVNSKASPLITHLPDAIEHGVEVRADSMAIRVEVDDSGRRVTGVTYVRDGREQRQRAAAVAVCGYAIESPRLLLNSTSAHWPDALGNACDQVGRCVMG